MPIRVLIAHRDPAVHELATRALARMGVVLDSVYDFADALSCIAREPYGIIVLERDDAVLAAIAAAYDGTKPVVIVTASDSHDLDADIVSLFIPEPYDAQTLVGVILACATPETTPPPVSAADEQGLSE